MTICFILDRSLNSFLFVAGLLTVALASTCLVSCLRSKITRRKQRITWGLADALDLMVIAVEAGLGLNAALNRVGEELKNVAP